MKGPEEGPHVHVQDVLEHHGIACESARVSVDRMATWAMSVATSIRLKHPTGGSTSKIRNLTITRVHDVPEFFSCCLPEREREKKGDIDRDREFERSKDRARERARKRARE